MKHSLFLSVACAGVLAASAAFPLTVSYFQATVVSADGYDDYLGANYYGSLTYDETLMVDAAGNPAPFVYQSNSGTNSLVTEGGLELSFNLRGQTFTQANDHLFNYDLGPTLYLDPTDSVYSVNDLFFTVEETSTLDPLFVNAVETEIDAVDILAFSTVGPLVETTGGEWYDYTIGLSLDVEPVPLPATAWLMIGSLGALAGLRRRKKSA